MCTLYYFLFQLDTHLHPLQKPRLLMLPAEGTDGIYDPIHLPEGHTVHSLIQILKGCLYSIRVGIVAFVVIDEEHLQNGVGIAAVVGWVFFRLLPQYRNILIHSR